MVFYPVNNESNLGETIIVVKWLIKSESETQQTHKVAFLWESFSLQTPYIRREIKCEQPERNSEDLSRKPEPNNAVYESWWQTIE